MKYFKKIISDLLLLLHYRGEAPYDNESVIYVEREGRWMSGAILSTADLFRTEPKVLLYGGKDFKMEGPYLFATKTSVGS